MTESTPRKPANTYPEEYPPALACHTELFDIKIDGAFYYICPICNPNMTTNIGDKGLYGACKDCKGMIEFNNPNGDGFWCIACKSLYCYTCAKTVPREVLPQWDGYDHDMVCDEKCEKRYGHLHD